MEQNYKSRKTEIKILYHKMPILNQTDCFAINRKFWKILAIDPFRNTTGSFYYYYSKLFVIFIVFLYGAFGTINFYFLERQLDIIIEEMILYFTEISVASKVITFMVMRKEIVKIFEVLEKDVFQPVTLKELRIIKNAEKFIFRYWKIVAGVSLTSNVTHVSSPFITHLLMSTKLELPVSSYSFIPEATREHFIYPLFLYQSIGMHFHMWYTVNVDTYFLGLMILVIAQLDILDEKLRNLTNASVLLSETRQGESSHSDTTAEFDEENSLVEKLNKSIVHFEEISKFCSQIQSVFSVTLFVQFSIASTLICVCLFRFTLPAPHEYYIFLATYMFIMTIQILVPCWFGTRIRDKSKDLSIALYDCDWTPRPRRFKTNLRLFVERTNRPLSIIGWKMFPLLLTTFTSIMNSAYSFFTLLRHVQSRQ